MDDKELEALKLEAQVADQKYRNAVAATGRAVPEPGQPDLSNFNPTSLKEAMANPDVYYQLKKQKPDVIARLKADFYRRTQGGIL